MKRVYFSHGDKGGVGKSVVASALIDILIEDNQSVALLEGDSASTDVLPRYIRHIPFGAISLNRAGDQGAAVDKMFEFVESLGGVDNIVVNLPAGASETLDMVSDPIAQAFEALGFEMTVIWSLGKSEASIKTLESSCRTGMMSKAKPGNRIIVYPLFQGDPESFAWHKSEARFETSMPETNFPALRPPVVFDQAMKANRPFSELVNDDTGQLNTFGRIVLKKWLAETRAALSLILPGAVE